MYQFANFKHQISLIKKISIVQSRYVYLKTKQYIISGFIFSLVIPESWLCINGWPTLYNLQMIDWKLMDVKRYNARDAFSQIYIFPLSSLQNSIAQLWKCSIIRIKLNEVSLFRIRAEIIANRLKYVIRNESSVRFSLEIKIIYQSRSMQLWPSMQWRSDIHELIIKQKFPN